MVWLSSHACEQPVCLSGLPGGEVEKGWLVDGEMRDRGKFHFCVHVQ